MEKYYSINAEGCSVRCKLYSDGREETKTVILYGHGFGGHKDTRAAERVARRVFAKSKGVVLIVFDWPCHGEDARKLLRLEDCSHYLSLVLSDIRKKYPEAALYAYATSFGGYLFLKYISEVENPFVKIALRCPAVNMYQVLTGAVMTEENRRLLARGRPASVGFDRKIEIDRSFLESLQKADITERDYLPLADDLPILHGTKDEIVPFDAVRAFAENNVIDFIPVEGADHRFQDPGKMDLAIGQIAAFFGLLPRSGKTL